MPPRLPAKLGPYEIEGLIGKGGMGEVYRARDARLGRYVAIKILPDGLCENPGRQARFEHEARALSALNHPNIVSVYDIGKESGIPFIVSEFIEGESLRRLIEGGPVPAGKLIEIAVQVAEGMKAAHAAGVVHRDLKPENIMLTHDGRVKILDFGLAKQTPQNMETAQSTETQVSAPGVLMGTIGYMSPEQVRGKAVDARSDIFSLGAVLYEIAAGKRAFAGGNTIEVLSAILRDEPARFQAGVPPVLDRLIRRCLEKLPERRFQSDADLAFALEQARGALEFNRIARPNWVLGSAWAGSAVLIAGIFGGIAYYDRQAPAGGKATSKAEELAKSEPAVPTTATGEKTKVDASQPVTVKRAEAITATAPLGAVPGPAQPAGPKSTPIMSSERRETVTKELAKALAEARYSDAIKDLNEATKAAVEPDLQRKWEQIRQDMGGIRWFSSPLLHANTEFVWFELQRGVVDVKAEFGKDGRVSALYWFYYKGGTQDAEYGVQTSPVNAARTREADDQGERLFAQQKYDDAINRFDEAIQNNAEYAEAYRGRCAVLVRLKQYNRALLDCTHAIHLKSDDAQAYRWRGDASAGFKHWDYAIVAFDQAIRLRADNNVFYNERAWAYGNEARYDLCVEDATSGIRLNPKNSSLWTNRSFCYEHLQQYDLAAEDATQVINLTNDPRDYNRRGSFYTAAKQYQRAIADFNEALRLKPDYKDAYNNRGFAKDMLGDAAGAAADRKYARELPQ